MKLLSTLALVAIMLICLTAKGQISKPVKWSFTAKRTSTNDATIYIKATIDDGWHIYALNNPDNGPVRTSFNFIPEKSYQLSGKVGEPKPLRKFEKFFDADINYFEKVVVFQQKIKLVDGKGIVKGTVEYTVCSEQQCLPPKTLDFSVIVE
ncbi:Disulphide bond corrector protein DsbC [Chitinophaga sp. CF118]|uniref:protein-disulfide reductase DsbD domain-containing protein n=1 Tax=Chitinophaga sp. CF118 TaxID=1884367 RepID=UPI0008F21938|nr:protein-disulfide reductase DsbD domain-containing protein [Chitinophaga sp. CF118]SFD97872.1 Disulphide bond corrector protein DsbC [Chitinophaga sp. CF118]